MLLRLCPATHTLPHLIVLAEVARIKSGGTISAVAPEVRVVMEALIGHPYEECWGNNAVCQKIFGSQAGLGSAVHSN